MTRRLIGLLITLALGLSLAPLAAEAQPSPPVYRIGRLTSGHPPAGPDLNLEAFRQGLRALGYPAFPTAEYNTAVAKNATARNTGSALLNAIMSGHSIVQEKATLGGDPIHRSC